MNVRVMRACKDKDTLGRHTKCRAYLTFRHRQMNLIRPSEIW